jgi:osmotically-inducible protein OsmY
MPNDSHLQAAVLAELRWEPAVQAGHIGVAARAGIVTLTGHVETLAAKHAAEQAALRVRGVLAVAGELVIRLSPETERSDEAIAAASVERLAWNSAIPKDAVQVTVEQGWVTLTGDVPWHFQKAAAEGDVRCLLGVTGVTNNVAIAPPLEAESVSDDIMHALHRSWFFDPKTINVAVDDGTVRLTGSVQNSHDSQLAAATAWAAPGVIDVINELTIA